MNNSHSQLTLIDRHQIQALNGLGYSARKIAINMQRSNKTISQDIGRCKPNKYCAETAHLDAQQKRQNVTNTNLGLSNILRIGEIDVQIQIEFQSMSYVIER